jgi:hypothetical protein
MRLHTPYASVPRTIPFCYVVDARISQGAATTAADLQKPRESSTY